jgi:hypothetical protein
MVCREFFHRANAYVMPSEPNEHWGVHVSRYRIYFLYHRTSTILACS